MRTLVINWVTNWLRRVINSKNISHESLGKKTELPCSMTTYTLKNLEVFPNLTTILKNYTTLPIICCEAEGNYLNFFKIEFPSATWKNWIIFLVYRKNILQNHCLLKRKKRVCSSKNKKKVLQRQLIKVVFSWFF